MAVDRAVGSNLQDGAYTPVKYSTIILDKFYDNSCVPQIANHNYEGEISGMGAKVMIPKVPDIQVKKYRVGQGLQRQRIQGSNTELDINYGNYFDITVEDVDALQSNLALRDMFVNDAEQQLRLGVEDQVLKSIWASSGYTIDATTTPVTQANALSYLLQASLRLDQASRPETDRWMVIDPVMAYFLKLSDLKAAYLTGESTTPLRTSDTGKVIAGFRIYISNRLYQKTPGAPGTTAKILCGHMSALTFAGQINKMETLRNPNDFGDEIRGLIIYGYSVINAPSQVTIDATYGALQ